MDTTVYEDHARRICREHGYAEARRRIIRDRDNSSPGTYSYAFSNAALKALNRMRDEEAA